MNELIYPGNVFKLTGPPEHWVTTYKTGFWGLEEKHRNNWHKLKKGTLCIFHSTSSSSPKTISGIIGMGVVERCSEKSTLEWKWELENKENRWPLLVHFSSFIWTSQSKLSDTNTRSLLSNRSLFKSETAALSTSILPFSKLKVKLKSGIEESLIPAMGSIGQVPDEKIPFVASIFKSYLKPRDEPPSLPGQAAPIEEIKRQIETVVTGTSLSTSSVRTGQDAFSKEVKKNFKNRCAFPGCEVNDSVYLIGAHIERWADNEEKRGNISNGICLCRMHDLAFELGHFIIADDLSVRVNETLIGGSEWAKNHLLNSTGVTITKPLSALDQTSLKAHRDRISKKTKLK